MAALKKSLFTDVVVRVLVPVVVEPDCAEAALDADWARPYEAVVRLVGVLALLRQLQHSKAVSRLNALKTRLLRGA